MEVPSRDGLGRVQVARQGLMRDLLQFSLCMMDDVDDDGASSNFAYEGIASRLITVAKVLGVLGERWLSIYTYTEYTTIRFSIELSLLFL